MTGSSCVCKPRTGAYLLFFRGEAWPLQGPTYKHQCVHMNYLSRALVTKPSKSPEILYYITSNAFSISAKKGLGT